jgi:hypothetical protein
MAIFLQNSLEKLTNFNRINGDFENTIKETSVLIDMKNSTSISIVKLISNIYKGSP